MQEKERALQLYLLRNNDKFVNLHLFDYILCHIYSKAVLENIASKWESFPFYIQAEVPLAVRQKAFSGLLNDTDVFLSEYWLENALRVLQSYKNSNIPSSKDLRENTKVLNLLSKMGEKELQKLINYFEKGKIGEEVILQAMNASNKFLLNISLFKNFDRLKNSTHYSRPQFGRIILSASSGCYNMCAHCGFSAKSPVSHMPYPIFLQLIHLFGRNLRSPYTGVSQFYSDSDPIAYRDYVIGADMGDICRYIRTELPQQDSLYATIVSKGVLQKGDDVILAKILENSSISLSFVDLPGEKSIDRNKERIERSLGVLNQVSKERRGKNVVEIRHICLPDNLSENAGFNLSEDTLFKKIAPVFNGRWVNTCSKEKLPFHYRGERTGFSSYPNTIIKSDGTICECALKTNGFDFRWKKLGSIFDFMEKEKC